MNTQAESGSGGRFFIMLASVVIVVAGLRAASAVLVPLILARFLAILGMPGLVWLQKRRIPGVLAVGIVVLGLVGLLALAGLLAGESINQFTEAIPRYRKRFDQLLDSGAEWFKRFGIEITLLKLIDAVDPSRVMDLVAGALKGLAAALSNVVLVLLTVMFLLLEALGFPAKFRAAFGAKGGADRWARVTADIQRYLFIKTWISLATGIVLGLWNYTLGVDFALLAGLTAFLLNFVPNLGSILAAIPPILVALIQLGPGPALLLMAGYIVVNFVLGNIIEPHIMGRHLNLSALVVFLSLVFWGWVWGAVGMILSVPIMIIIKILLENSEEWRWVAILMEPDGRARGCASADSGQMNSERAGSSGSPPPPLPQNSPQGPPSGGAPA